MKNLSYLMIAIAIIIMSCNQQAGLSPQDEESLKNQVLEWHNQYWDTYTNLQFADADKFYAEDVIAISNEFLVDYDEIIKTHRNASKSLINMNCIIDSLKIIISEKNHASIVGFGYGSQVDTSEKVTNLRFNYTMHVKKEAADWKIKTMHEYVNYYPLTFSDNIPPEKRTGNIGLNYKYRVSLMHTWSIFVHDFKFLKSKGVPVEEYANAMGEYFAAGWNSKGSFEGFCKGVIRNSQIFSTEAEVLEKTEELLKVRYFKYYKYFLPKEISDQEMMKFWEITNNKIADKMGATLTIQ
ncbi:MAG: hypothetical protein V2I54_12255, partial [Bacteroidales bacterium]|nr:hypothetical protein [Bacteroidales bacterium]